MMNPNLEYTAQETEGEPPVVVHILGLLNFIEF